MRFTINREEFLKALSSSGKAIASKVVFPALSNFKIELTEEGLVVTGSNESITIQSSIPFEKNGVQLIRNYKEGAVLINAKILLEIARKTESEELTLEVIDSTIATIADNDSEYKLNCVRAEEYLDLDLEADGEHLVMTTADFALMVEQTEFAASVKEQRPVLTAINLEAADGQLIATATDSARMARKVLNIPEDIRFNANVPARVMREVRGLVEGEPSVDISVSDKKALFKFGRTIVAARLVAGDYPNTRNIVPRVTNYLFEVNAAELLKAVDKANILSIDRENVVELSMSESEVLVSAKSSQVGSSVQKISTFRYEGEPLEVSFNSLFVSSAVKALGSEDIVFGFVGEMKPFVIKNSGDESVVQVVTPVRTH